MAGKRRDTHHNHNRVLSAFIFLGMILLFILLVRFVSQKKPVTDQPNKASGGNAFFCRAGNGAEMGMGEALTLAKKSDCGQKGTIIGIPYCNENTGTWWMDLDLWESKGDCDPACVVSVTTKNAEVNYRCLGGKPTEPSPCGWCGNQCQKLPLRACPAVEPPEDKICIFSDNMCKSVSARCMWCGDRCERTRSGQCTKTNTVPVGVSCDPVPGSSHCVISGLPVVSTNTPTHTPTPIPTRGPGYCDDSCETHSDCVGWLGCFDVGGGIKRCRKSKCTDEHTCFCPANTPTVTPTPIVKRIIIKGTSSPTVTSLIQVSPITIATPTETPLPTSIRVLSQGNLVSSGLPSFVMTGLAAPSSRVNVTIQPDNVSGTVDADADGAWTLTISTALPAGEKMASIVATDSLGSQNILDTTFTITGAVPESTKSAIPYVLVFILAGALAVALFFVFFLRHL